MFIFHSDFVGCSTMWRRNWCTIASASNEKWIRTIYRLVEIDLKMFWCECKCKCEWWIGYVKWMRLSWLDVCRSVHVSKRGCDTMGYIKLVFFFLIFWREYTQIPLVLLQCTMRIVLKKHVLVDTYDFPRLICHNYLLRSSPTFLSQS